MKKQYTRRNFFKKLVESVAGIGLSLGLVSLVKANESLGNMGNIEYESDLSEATSVKPRRPQGYYQDWKNLEREIEKAIKANKGVFPSYKRLQEMGYFGGLQHGITKYHGGFTSVREKLRRP